MLHIEELERNGILKLCAQPEINDGRGENPVLLGGKAWFLSSRARQRLTGTKSGSDKYEPLLVRGTMVQI
jgi:hypothetical protein